jgi:hypothetical protein
VGASAAVSLVATPTELLKCRLQAQGCSATARARLVAAGLNPAQHTIYTGPLGEAGAAAGLAAACAARGTACSACRGAVGKPASLGRFRQRPRRPLKPGCRALLLPPAAVCMAPHTRRRGAARAAA